jgi:hypothetical protein
MIPATLRFLEPDGRLRAAAARLPGSTAMTNGDTDPARIVELLQGSGIDVRVRPMR